MRALLLWLVQFYRKYIKIFKIHTCRFYPTCSEYAEQALRKKNILTALWLIFYRLCRCHPFIKGGVDPLI